MAKRVKAAKKPAAKFPRVASGELTTLLDFVRYAVSRFNAFSRLQRELVEARNALEERKVIERAKGILMKMRGMSEEQAFALLRQTAMNEKKKLADIAQSVVTAAGLLL